MRKKESEEWQMWRLRKEESPCPHCGQDLWLPSDAGERIRSLEAYLKTAITATEYWSAESGKAKARAEVAEAKLAEFKEVIDVQLHLIDVRNRQLAAAQAHEEHFHKFIVQDMECVVCLDLKSHPPEARDCPHGIALDLDRHECNRRIHPPANASGAPTGHEWEEAHSAFQQALNEAFPRKRPPAKEAEP